MHIVKKKMTKAQYSTSKIYTKPSAGRLHLQYIPSERPKEERAPVGTQKAELVPRKRNKPIATSYCVKLEFICVLHRAASAENRQPIQY